LLLSIGFRPFFLSAGIWAILAVFLWWLSLQGVVWLKSGFDATAWHRHEMLFGYFGAVVAGFVLTAVASWTGRAPVGGWRLATLWLLWLGARLGNLFAGLADQGLALVLDVGFFLGLAIVAGTEIVAARNRNLPVVIAVTMLAAASELDHAEAGGWIAGDGLGWRLGMAILIALVALIGGRIVPTFTRNWLGKRGLSMRLSPIGDRLGIAVLIASIAAVLVWAGAPQHRVVGYTLQVAGILQAVLLLRWEGWRCRSDALMLALHLAYAWLPVGLVLLGASIVSPGIPRSAALHALGLGALAFMTLAVMTRATLGHTGRELRADGLTIAAYVLLGSGAVLRVAASLVPAFYGTGIGLAASAWIGAFALFLAAYGPKLLGARLPGA
jgi:uncharacterized protein involved in response to NO